MRDLFRLLRFLWPHSPRALLGVLLGVVTVLMNVGLLATAAYLISAAALKPLLIALTAPIYLVRFFGVGRGFSRYMERLVSHSVTFRLLAGVRTWLYARLEPLAPAGLQGYRSGDLLSRIVKDVEELQNLYQRALGPSMVALATSLIVCCALYLFDPAIASATLGFLLASGVVVPVLAGITSSGLGKRQIAVRAEMDAMLVDSVQGVQDILAFGQERLYERRIAELDGEIERLARRQALVTGIRTGLAELIPSLAMWATLILAIPLVVQGRLEDVMLAMLALLVLASFEGVQPLGEAFQFFGRALAAGSRILEVGSVEPSVRDPERPLMPRSFADIEFRDVTFRYDREDAPTLRSVSFDVPAGSLVAVVGPSGSGKSTLINLILRFWDPESGEVRVNGEDIRLYVQRDLRTNFAVVAQNTHVFGGTLRSNLLLANPEASEDELHQALEVARLEAFVRSLSGGLDTWIGEQGARLSGGERQRLAIARALLKNAPMLLLDEPTANLDPQTEREALRAVDDLMQGRTVLMVTHRLVDMDRFDNILVVDGGELVESGTHSELLSRGGMYSRMYELQNDLIGAAYGDSRRD